MKSAQSQPAGFEPRFWLAKRCTLPVIILFTALGVGLTVLCLEVGYTIVFQNIFYIPIILSCSCYLRKGMIFATAISVIYFILMMVIPRDPALLAPALIRVAFFELIGIFTVLVCERESQIEIQFENQKRNIDKIIAERTRFLNNELCQCLDRETESLEERMFADGIIDSLPGPLVAWREDGTITRVNPAFCARARKSQTELNGLAIQAVADTVGIDPENEDGSAGEGQGIFWRYAKFGTANDEGKQTIALGRDITEGQA